MHVCYYELSLSKHKTLYTTIHNTCCYMHLHACVFLYARVKVSISRRLEGERMASADEMEELVANWELGAVLGSF